VKKVIDGVTYNTATSTQLATSEFENDDGHNVEAALYQTRGGAFFELAIETWGARHADGEWEERTRSTVNPLSPEEAHKWVLQGEVELMSAGEEVFGEPPEAEAEATASATIYLRVPAALKQRIERVAKKADQSVNVWAMRCLENCMGPAATE
jgi:predicted HicB family RNase H-like nuclease